MTPVWWLHFSKNLGNSVCYIHFVSFFGAVNPLYCRSAIRPKFRFANCYIKLLLYEESYPNSNYSCCWMKHSSKFFSGKGSLDLLFLNVLLFIMNESLDTDNCIPKTLSVSVVDGCSSFSPSFGIGDRILLFCIVWILVLFMDWLHCVKWNGRPTG